MDEKWRKEAEMWWRESLKPAKGLLWGLVLGTTGWLLLFLAIWLCGR